jgi:hypothetical protein
VSGPLSCVPSRPSPTILSLSFRSMRTKPPLAYDVLNVREGSFSPPSDPSRTFSQAAPLPPIAHGAVLRFPDATWGCFPAIFLPDPGILICGRHRGSHPQVGSAASPSKSGDRPEAGRENNTGARDSTPLAPNHEIPSQRKSRVCSRRPVSPQCYYWFVSSRPLLTPLRGPPTYPICARGHRFRRGSDDYGPSRMLPPEKPPDELA